MSFVNSNQEILQIDSCVHNINTRNNLRLPRPNAKLSCFQKRTFHAGIKIFKGLPPSVTIRRNDKAKFKATLIKYLHTPSF